MVSLSSPGGLIVCPLGGVGLAVVDDCVVYLVVLVHYLLLVIVIHRSKLLLVVALSGQHPGTPIRQFTASSNSTSLIPMCDENDHFCSVFHPTIVE